MSGVTAFLAKLTNRFKNFWRILLKHGAGRVSSAGFAVG